MKTFVIILFSLIQISNAYCSGVRIKYKFDYLLAHKTAVSIIYTLDVDNVRSLKPEDIDILSAQISGAKIFITSSTGFAKESKQESFDLTEQSANELLYIIGASEIFLLPKTRPHFEPWLASLDGVSCVFRRQVGDKDGISVERNFDDSTPSHAFTEKLLNYLLSNTKSELVKDLKNRLGGSP